MGMPHKVPFWLMAQPGAPPSLQSSVPIYSSRLCDLALALPTTTPVETPCGHIHHYLESRRANASDRNIHIHTLVHVCTHTAPSHHTHTGPVLEGRWASHCRHSEKISHPEGSAAWWARGVSGSVSLPSEELVWVCMRPILAHTKTHRQECKHAHTHVRGPSVWTAQASVSANQPFMILVCPSGSS